MNTFVTLLYGMGCLLLQSTVLRQCLPAWILPDPILLLVLYVSIWFPTGRGLLTSFALGLLADLLSGAPEGWNALFTTCVFALNRWVQARVFLGRSRSSLWLFLLDFGLKLPYIAVMQAFWGASFSRKIFPLWLGESLGSILALPVLFALLSRSLNAQRLRLLDREQVRRA